MKNNDIISQNENFSKDLTNRLMEVLNIKNVVGLSKVLGVRYTTLTSQIHRNSLDFAKILQLAEKKDLDLNYILLGRKTLSERYGTAELAQILLDRLKKELKGEITEQKRLYRKIEILYEKILTKDALSEAKEKFNKEVLD